jgi:polyhydroxyalkanoate synthesis repressor PhaR
MANEKQPVTIKKYANRRLYNTGTSTYVTLEDLAKMVKEGDDFVVYDARTGEDITRSVLAQIIFDQEGKEGQSLLPIAFLRQLIRFYGDSMQMLVPSYLEFSFDKFVGEQQKMREQFTSVLGAKAIPGSQMFVAMEEQARKNISLFNQALFMFNPFAAGAAQPGGATAEKTPPSADTESAPPAAPSADLENMKKQIADMQRLLEGLTHKGES